MLRIENTDQLRSNQEAINAIIEGMKWAGLDWKGDVVYQNNNLKRHLAIANELLENNKAYQ